MGPSIPPRDGKSSVRISLGVFCHATKWNFGLFFIRFQNPFPYLSHAVFCLGPSSWSHYMCSTSVSLKRLTSSHCVAYRIRRETRSSRIRTEELGETEHLECAGGVEDLRSTLVAVAEDEEDVVHGHGADHVHAEPALHVAAPDFGRVQCHLTTPREVSLHERRRPSQPLQV